MSLTMLSILGAAAAAAGLWVLRRCWAQGPTAAGPWRFGVAAGWGLLALALAAFVAGSRPIWGLAVGSLVVMGLALARVLAPAVQSPGWAPRPPRLEEREPPDRPEGYASRTTARALGALVVAPLLGLSAALAWEGLAPGHSADQLTGAAAAAPLAFTAALVAVLAAGRPWRAAAILTGLALACAGLAFAPALLGA